MPTDTPEPPAVSLSADGRYEATEFVGVPTVVKVNVTNTGGDLQHVILMTYDFAKVWVINGISTGYGQCSEIGDHDYDCGPLSAGSQMTVSFDLDPMAVGNYSPSIGFATGIDQSVGMVDPNTMLDHPSLSMDVAVNP